MNTLSIDDILHEAEKVSSLIAAAHGLMSEGKTIDLSNLEAKIRTLCTHAETSSQEDDAAPVRNALIAIAGDLDQLNVETEARFRKAGGGAIDNTIKRAIDAYGPESQED